MYYIFYKTDDSGNDPQGAFLTQDISSYSLQQGDDIYIEWTLGIPSLLDTQLPLYDSFVYPMVWSGASYPDTRVNVYVYGGDDGNGTAYGTLIMHHAMAAQSGSASFFDEDFLFNRTLGSGVGAVTTTDTTKFNKIMFKVAKITSGQTFFIDDVDFGYDTTTTNHWSLNANVINSNGTLIFSDSGQAVQNNATGVESGKLYRVTAVFSTPDGYGVQNAIVSANGVGINAGDTTANNPTYIQSGTVVREVYFPSTTNDITIDVSGGNINILSITIQEIEQYGGTVDCWDLNGGGADGIAGTSDDDNFIFTSQASGGSIVFDEAPQNTYLHQELMNTNQALDFDIGTNCTISFNITNYVGSGDLTFMLYNDEGEGFEHTISGNGSYSFSSIIGNDSSSTLSSKFGFYVSSTNTFSGEVDNVDIVLDGKNIGKTISFNEKSKGWTSLKSFIPEVAISSVNQYYTMNFGQLWKHHQEFELDGTTVVDRNTFYGVFEDSSVTPILNMQPAVVKNFNTLNYEGSQSKIDQFLTYEAASEQPFPIGDNLVMSTVSSFWGIQLIFPQPPNSSASFTNTNNNISIVDLHGESGQSDIIQITMPNLDTVKTYRLSFGFSVTGPNFPTSHVYFGASSINPVVSTSLSNGVFSEDFTPTNTTEYVSILHPHLYNGFTADVNVELTNVLLQELDFTTDENDGEYYNLQAKKGWYIEDIHTDKQEGTLNEFIEKEGKWFNYIKGKPGEIDTAAFNFQGLGMVETIDIL